jgi:hypothetical protein
MLLSFDRASMDASGTDRRAAGILISVARRFKSPNPGLGSETVNRRIILTPQFC